MVLTINQIVVTRVFRDF